MKTEQISKRYLPYASNFKAKCVKALIWIKEIRMTQNI